MKFLGHRRSANNVPALKHLHFQARAREVAGAGEAIVAGPDDERVVAAQKSLTSRSLDCNGLGKIAGLVDVGAARERCVVSKQLQWHDM